ncbi:MAG TPA: methyltransferase domain-containing protein [Candidatus Binataceae bacterium]|nr:methyltransferase domain-containing protein [Candidatus Binataceae bacterium]
MQESIKYAFDRTAETYDRARRKLVPCFDEFYRAAIEALPFAREREITVLDLGAGTGLLSAFVAFSYPRARIVMVDISDEMLAQARERFEAGGARFSFEVADYGEGRITGRYDAIISALSIHHLSDEKKRVVYAQAYAALNEGGILVNADQVRGETPAIERRNHEMWLKRATEIGVPEQDLKAALERMKFDRTATVSAQLGWLGEIGFREVGVTYRNLIFAVYAGIK